MTRFMGEQGLPRPALPLEPAASAANKDGGANNQNWFSSLIAGPRAETTAPSKEQSRESSPSATPTHQVGIFRFVVVGVLYYFSLFAFYLYIGLLMLCGGNFSFCLITCALWLNYL